MSSLGRCFAIAFVLVIVRPQLRKLANAMNKPPAVKPTQQTSKDEEKR